MLFHRCELGQKPDANFSINSSSHRVVQISITGFAENIRCNNSDR
jgi:hypothetical protein